jgi:hypothetical protein
MLDILPAEVTVNVLSHLPIPSLLSLPGLSRKWFDLFTRNQSAIFHSAALLHEYIQPGTLLLEDALSVNKGRPWAGSTSWKDFCESQPYHSLYPSQADRSRCEGHRSFQLHKNWEGKGRAVAQIGSSHTASSHRIKVDEKAGICIMTHFWGGLTVTHLFSDVVLWRLPMVRQRFLVLF